MTRATPPRTEAAPTINPYRLFQGSFLPHAVEQLPKRRLSSDAKICYGRLLRFAGKRGVAFPHVRTLAQAVGQSRRSVERALRQLRLAGLIQSFQRGKGRAALIRFYLPADIFGSVCHAPPPVAGQNGHAPPRVAGQKTSPPIVRARGLEVSHTEEVSHRSAGGRAVARGPVFSERGHQKNQQRLAKLLGGIVKPVPGR
jgi:helix-turn-helix protein